MCVAEPLEAAISKAVFLTLQLLLETSLSLKGAHHLMSLAFPVRLGSELRSPWWHSKHSPLSRLYLRRQHFLLCKRISGFRWWEILHTVAHWQGSLVTIHYLILVSHNPRRPLWNIFVHCCMGAMCFRTYLLSNRNMLGKSQTECFPCQSFTDGTLFKLHLSNFSF